MIFSRRGAENAKICNLYLCFKTNNKQQNNKTSKRYLSPLNLPHNIFNRFIFSFRIVFIF